jgi:hypothetical protein
MICKHCGKFVGRWYSELDEHLWVNHRSIRMQFLDEQTVKESKN